MILKKVDFICESNILRYQLTRSCHVKHRMILGGKLMSVV